MVGVFKRAKVWRMFLICGVFFVGRFLFLSFSGSEEPGIASFVLLGGVITLCGIILFFLNYKAHFEILDGHILSKYNFFGKLDCKIADVAFVDVQTNTLSILLKNGKRHVIMGIENSWLLACEIRRRIYSIETESPDKLRQELTRAQATHKKELYLVLGGVALLFVNIFVAALLTGGRETYDFSPLDWTFFVIMGALEIATTIAVFYFANRCGKGLLPIQQLVYRLRASIIATQPLPAGNVRAVYTDENNSGRIVVCGLPNSEDVYYCVQEFIGSDGLETVQTSEFFASEDELFEEALPPLIDITHHFLIRSGH